MADATPEEIRALVEDMDRGREAWISGRLEETATTLMAQADDMTIVGPFGGLGRGGPELAARQAATVARFAGGSGRSELVSAFASGDLVVLVMIERSEVTFAGEDRPRPWILRTTQVSGVTERAGSASIATPIRSSDPARSRTPCSSSIPSDTTGDPYARTQQS